jgi:hypothetical protein
MVDLLDTSSGTCGDRAEWILETVRSLGKLFLRLVLVCGSKIFGRIDGNILLRVKEAGKLARHCSLIS